MQYEASSCKTFWLNNYHLVAPLGPNCSTFKGIASILWIPRREPLQTTSQANNHDSTDPALSISTIGFHGSVAAGTLATGVRRPGDEDVIDSQHTACGNSCWYRWVRTKVESQNRSQSVNYIMSPRLWLYIKKVFETTSVYIGRSTNYWYRTMLM